MFRSANATRWEPVAAGRGRATRRFSTGSATGQPYPVTADLFHSLLSEVIGGFCRRDPSGSKLVVTVKNQGVAPAAASHTTVNFTAGGTVSAVSLSTPMVLAGDSVDVVAAIPSGCFTPDCSFQIVVDAAQEVQESNEGNNVADGLCRG